MALVDAMDLVADPDRVLSELEQAGEDPAGQLAAAVGFDRRLLEDSGDLIRLLREAARTEPDLAEAHRIGPRRGAEAMLRLFTGWPDGTLRAGREPARAVDVYAAVATVESYTELTGARGWSPVAVQELWTGIVVRELLA